MDPKDLLLDRLCDEVERLRRREVAFALDLAAARKERDEARAALREVLEWMTISAKNGPSCRRSRWIAEGRVLELERLARGGGGGA